jgi:hypothetical protein
MEFTTYYPTTNQAETPSSPQSLRYTHSSQIPTSSGPEPSHSYAAPETNDHVYSHIDALVEGISVSPQADPLERFMSARKRFLGHSVQDMLELVYERETLKYENILRMIYESAHIGSHLLELGDWQVGAFKDIDKTRSQLEKEIANLEKERRMEEVSCWRDITRLKSELRETLKEFNHEKEKEGLLGAHELQ